MKFKLIYPLLGGLFAALLMSNAGGTANSGSGNKTGSPLSSGDCEGCHSSTGGDFTGSNFNFSVKDSRGNTVYSYIPGNQYTVEINFSTASGNTITGYGFQVQALNASNTATVGTLAAGDANQQRVINGLIEQKFLLSNSRHTFYWTAPSSNIGGITFYASLLFADGNSGVSRDLTRRYSQVLSYGGVAVEEVANAGSAQVFPNPAQHTLHAEFTNLSPKTYQMEVISLNGQIMQQKTLEIAHTKELINIPLERFAVGMYLLRLSDAGVNIHTQIFVKE